MRGRRLAPFIAIAVALVRTLGVATVVPIRRYVVDAGA